MSSVLRDYTKRRATEMDKEARSAFEHHELLERHFYMSAGNSWCSDREAQRACWEIGRPKHSEFRVQITAAAAQGFLVLTGDIDTAAWAYGPKLARARLAWMGLRVKGVRALPSVSCYFMQKLSIGSGGDRDRWLAQLELLDNRRERVAPAGAARTVFGLLANEAPRDEVLAALTDEDPNAWEWAGSLGMRPSSTCYYLQHALRRCHELEVVAGG